MVENSSRDEDAFNIRLQTISLNNQISASIRLVKRVAAGQFARPEVILSGNVPHSHAGELEMVYFAHPVRREFVTIDENHSESVQFPMVVTFEDYSKIKYRAFFEFTDNLDNWDRSNPQITFVRREKLVAMRPV